jgi:hypothetical protein
MSWSYKPEYTKVIQITLDPDKGLFYVRKLSFEEVRYLENHGYKSVFFVPIGKTRQEEVLIKPAPPESLIHTFLVLDIRDKFKRYVKNLRVSKTKEPDILFENYKEQTIALEIETGKGFNKHKTRIKEKFEILKEKYKKNVYIILTDSNQKRKYRSLIPNIKIMTRKDIPTFFETQKEK